MTQGLRTNSRTIAAKLLRFLWSAALILCFGFLLGLALHHAEAALDRRQEPAGFVRGVVQGALMPLALPNLIVGNDVPIYAARNTGRMYKLGYTAGVNACGLFFASYFSWRLRRLRRIAFSTEG